MYSTQSSRSISPLLLWRWRLDACFYRFSAVSPKVIGCSDLCFTILLSLFRFHRHATPPALPARGGNATAALALTGAAPEEVAIHSGVPTTEGHMSYIEEAFDPCSRTDPRLTVPGVLDIDMQ